HSLPKATLGCGFHGLGRGLHFIDTLEEPALRHRATLFDYHRRPLKRRSQVVSNPINYGGQHHHGMGLIKCEEDEAYVMNLTLHRRHLSWSSGARLLSRDTRSR
ncbi:MAG: hypothetical protein RL326_1509, partial [Pseudomonadota bacterium]